ncbi:hypothetical protein [Hymenobacter terrigena]
MDNLTNANSAIASGWAARHFRNSFSYRWTALEAQGFQITHSHFGGGGNMNKLFSTIHEKHHFSC